MREREGQSVRQEYSEAARKMILLNLIPPGIVAAAATTLLATELQLESIKMEWSDTFRGVTAQTNSHGECHIGVHPKWMKEIHIYCSDGSRVP